MNISKGFYSLLVIMLFAFSCAKKNPVETNKEEKHISDYVIVYISGKSPVFLFLKEPDRKFTAEYSNNYDNQGNVTAFDGHFIFDATGNIYHIKVTDIIRDDTGYATNYTASIQATIDDEEISGTLVYPYDIEYMPGSDLSNFSDITEKDTSNNFIGKIDRNDWSPNSYQNVYFGNNFWLHPSNSIIFEADTANQIIIKRISIYNSGQTNLQFSTSVLSPFFCNTPQIVVSPNSINYFDVGFKLPDTSTVYQEIMNISSSSTNENIQIVLEGKKKSDVWSHPGPAEYTFYPAFPNPANNNVTLMYNLPQPSDVLLWILNKNGEIIRILLLGRKHQAGQFMYTWDLKDKNGNYVSAGLYRTFLKIIYYYGPTFYGPTFHGDILIE